jgi:hypothetical protein
MRFSPALPDFVIESLGQDTRTLLIKHFGLFGEWKFTHSRLEVVVTKGHGGPGENTQHLVGGITIPLPSF